MLHQPPTPPDARCSMLDARCSMLDARCSMLDARCSMLDKSINHPAVWSRGGWADRVSSIEYRVVGWVQGWVGGSSIQHRDSSIGRMGGIGVGGRVEYRETRIEYRVGGRAYSPEARSRVGRSLSISLASRGRVSADSTSRGPHEQGRPQLARQPSAWIAATLTLSPGSASHPLLRRVSK
jgi:hypothetical protein